MIRLEVEKNQVHRQWGVRISFLLPIIKNWTSDSENYTILNLLEKDNRAAFPLSFWQLMQSD